MPEDNGKKESEDLTDEEKLEKLTTPDEDILYIMHTVFPFTLFPDSVYLYRNRIVLVYRILPLIKREFPIIIKDVKNVVVNSGPLFASMKLEITGYEQNPEPIDFLDKKSAYKFKNIVMGMVVMLQNDIDVNNLSSSEIIEKSQIIS